MVVEVINKNYNVVPNGVGENVQGTRLKLIEAQDKILTNSKPLLSSSLYLSISKSVFISER